MSYFSFNAKNKKCCGICKFWGGARGEYNPRNGIVKVDSNASGACIMNHNQQKKGNNSCPKFVKDYMYDN